MGKAARQRQAAQVVRQQMEAEKRRKRVMITAAVVVGVLLVGGAIFYGVMQSRKDSGPVTEPTAASVDYGFVTGNGPVKVDVYFDFMCPACKAFEAQFAEPLQQAAKAGQITLNNHPVAILNRFSQGTEYSTRAGAASVCAADAGKFTEYAAALYAQQPKENSTGLTNDQLASIGTDMGLDATFASCTTGQTYAGWIDKATENASDNGLTGTPFLRINGEVVKGEEFGTKLQAALAAAGVATAPSASAS